MKHLTGSQIRQLWLDFFKSKGHEIIPSASLVPHNDPTLLWINAGVAPLKKYFDGREIPKNPRMTNAQKSIRTNDIENVGKTARHHTFFEMLGNFSIGDYFREEVLTWAYELLFDEKWFNFDKNLIYITYYPNDTKTFEKWVTLGVAKDHLIPITDNFWEIGEGPCGPDTEIFFDRGVKYDPENLGIKMLQEDIENDRYIEIWNIVFSQFNSVTGLNRTEYPELPSKNIDTGSGLERLACIFQETETNYETDLFMPMIKFIEEYTGVSYENSKDKMPFRVIVDHIRSVTFAVADGAMLSNEGRGYVLRRILRRAVRYARVLGINEPFLYKMVSIVIDNMKDFYGYLLEKQELIERIVKTEEENFLRTLSTGEKKLSDIMETSANNTITGADAFLLYDTFGFPIELTIEVCEDKGFAVDIDGFKEELQKQKTRARNARNDSQSMNMQNEEYMKFNLESKFVGYDEMTCKSNIIAIFKDGKSVNEAEGLVQVVLDKTPFYAEMGGQIGDEGLIESFVVSNTFKLPNGQHAHTTLVNNGTLKVGQIIEASVNLEFRNSICQNHSATHLVNEALRHVLGNHVSQQGSQVTNYNLRFDFNHYKNLTIEEILKIEDEVNKVINQSIEVKTIETSLEDAKSRGAQAMFGEKYGDVVRLVDMEYSKELCGGTHVKNTSDINKFAITMIESKGSGVFRIEAVASDNLYELIENTIKNTKEDVLDVVSKVNNLVNKASAEGYSLNKPNINLPALEGSYIDIINYRKCAETAKKMQKDLDKEYDSLKRNAGSSSYKDFETKMFDKDNAKILVEKVENYDLNTLKDVVDKIANDFDKCVIFFANVVEDKIIFIAKAKGVNVHCGNLVKEAAIATGGNGGGRPDFAQAGGKDITLVNNALEIVKGKI